ITAIADKRLNSSLKSAIRRKIIETVLAKGQNMLFYEFVSYMFTDQMVKEIERNIKQVYNIKRIEIRKSNLLSTPEEKQIEENTASA
ncbi:MAG: 30S ribosomal protein S3ae, partial [Thermoplasmata archaeon]